MLGFHVGFVFFFKLFYPQPFYVYFYSLPSCFVCYDLIPDLRDDQQFQRDYPGAHTISVQQAGC